MIDAIFTLALKVVWTFVGIETAYLLHGYIRFYSQMFGG